MPLATISCDVKPVWHSEMIVYRFPAGVTIPDIRDSSKRKGRRQNLVESI